MNKMNFILVVVQYRHPGPKGDGWENRGEQILNVDHIGKVSPWNDSEPR
jgi:hypothetical protein